MASATIKKPIGFASHEIAVTRSPPERESTFSLSTKPRPASPSKISNRFAPSTTPPTQNGSGSSTSFVKTTLRLLTLLAPRRQVSYRPRYLSLRGSFVQYRGCQLDLYPGNQLTQDEHCYYFPSEIAICDDSSSEEATILHNKWSERRSHFFHSLATHIVETCIERGVGRIHIGELEGEGVREDENGTTVSQRIRTHTAILTYTDTSGRSTASPRFSDTT